MRQCPLSATVALALQTLAASRACDFLLTCSPCTRCWSPLLVHDGEHVRLAQDQILFVFELERGAGVLRVQHGLSDRELPLEPLAAIQDAPGPDGDDLAQI